MPELTSGQPYTIVSVSQGGEAAGVNGLLPLPWQFVRLREQSNVWDITKRGPDLYHFAVKDIYPYSGVYENKVIASIEPDKDTIWYVTFRESQDAFTIAWDNNHNKVWTVTPGGEIVIEDIKYLPPTVHPPLVDPSQLFRFDLVPL